MYMITFDLMLSAKAQIRVDIKQNMFEFRTFFTARKSQSYGSEKRVPGYLARLRHHSRRDDKAMK